MIKVKMIPGIGKNRTNGIMQVIAAYQQYMPEFGVRFVNNNWDLIAAHAGEGGTNCDVCHCHGLYWTGDYVAPQWEFKGNKLVIDALRNAGAVTVPSEWVAETIRRDMHLNPYVVPHGIQWEAWQGVRERSNYVLYNKNRQGDVCDSSPMMELSKMSPETQFVTTFGKNTHNVRVTGVMSHDKMKALVQNSGVYVATTKETFGIGTLEAMASGVPVLGYDYGGTAELIEHGVNGYLAEVGNVDDLFNGLLYCQENNKILGENARQIAKRWNWERVCKMVVGIYEKVLQPSPPTVAIVIPAYNYAHLLPYAIESALTQDYDQLEVVVVNDGSSDNTSEIVKQFEGKIKYIEQKNSGVAIARNIGIKATNAKYICCLDADDMLEPNYVSTLVPALEENRSLGIAYSKLVLLYKDG